MTTTHAEDLFAERDAEDEVYNPKLSMSQLMTPTPDPKLGELGEFSLVRFRATVRIGERTVLIEYAKVMTQKAMEEVVFEVGPTFSTELIDATPLTNAERDVALKLLNP